MEFADIDSAVTQFATASAVNDRAEAIAWLVKQKKLGVATADKRFVNALDALISAAANGSSVESLSIVALLMRIAASARSERSRIERGLSSVNLVPLSSLQELEDPDDRRYVAQALQILRGDWVQPYCAREIVLESAGEKTRKELAAALIRSGSSLVAMLQSLAGEMSSWAPTTDDIAETRATRLRRILSTIRPLIVESPPDAGDAPGTALALLVKATFEKSGLPSDRAILIGTSEEIIRAAYDLIRAHFSLSTVSDTYAALAIVRAWYLPGSWPADLDDALSRLGEAVKESLKLLALQGIADNKLFDVLALLVGNEPARKMMISLESETQNLSQELRDWLRSGRLTNERRVSGLAEEANLIELDQGLAETLIDATIASAGLSSILDDIANSLSLHDPDLVPPLKRMASNVGILVQDVNQVASRRGLRLRGQPNQVVEFSPIEHEVTGAVLGARKVRLKAPMVEKQTQGLAAKVILKAKVEPA